MLNHAKTTNTGSQFMNLKFAYLDQKSVFKTDLDRT